MNSTILQAHGIGKEYRLYATQWDRLKSLLGLQVHAESHWALQDVSFALRQGQCLGVIGDNGAGKSTLLKLLAGTLQPTHGSLQRVGRVTAILELGAGFHPDFTGRENLHFGAGMIDISADEIQRLTPEIIEFAELADAIDRPVKTYSSGMTVRLAFALVTAVQPELLIIDEALAVGDQHFQKKCVERIAAFRQNGCTVLFCSHSLYHVRQLCDQVLWLNKGQVAGLGPTEGVLAAYEAHVRQQDDAENRASVVVANNSVPSASANAGLLSASVQGMGPGGVLGERDLVITVTANTHAQELAPSFGVMLEQAHGVGITSLATHAEGVAPTLLDSSKGRKTWQVKLIFPDLPLHSGHYVLSFYLFDAAGLVVLDEWKDYIAFQWLSPSLTPGLVRLPHRWIDATSMS